MLIALLAVLGVGLVVVAAFPNSADRSLESTGEPSDPAPPQQHNSHGAGAGARPAPWSRSGAGFCLTAGLWGVGHGNAVYSSPGPAICPICS
jgi:hypothetical protein